MKKYLLLALLSATVFSCKKTENKIVEPVEKSIKAFKVETPTDTTIFKSNSILVKSDINNKYLSRTDNSITFNNDESLSLVNVGDVIYSQPTSFAPNGYAYRVTGITNVGSTTSFSTEYACLEDVVSKTSQYRDYVLESDALKSQFYKTLQWLPDFNALATGITVESTLNTTKASNFLERISKRIKSHSITATEATMQYIFFDKDGQFETTTNDQVILEFKLKYNLANTHLFLENGYFNFQGSHKWDFSAYFIWEASTALTENDKKDFKEKLKNEIMGKRFNVLSVDLLPATPTTLAFRPKLDIFYKIGFDLKGEFKIGGELTNLRYDFKVENTIGNPTLFTTSGSILNQGTFTGKVEALVELDVSLGFGLGITCYFPAFEYEKEKKSYIGLYTDVTATFRPNLSNFTYNQTNGKMCADIDLPYSLNWQTYLEAKVGIWRNKVTLPQPNPIVLVTVPPFNGTLGTKTICVPLANIDLLDGLIAFYPFNGNANDLSGNNNNGVLIGATSTTDRKGSPNSAYNFDGISNYIEVPHNTTLNIKDEISISVWINPVNTNGDQRIIDKTTVSQGDAYMIDTRPSQELRFIVGNPNPSNPPMTSAIISQSNKWYYIVTTYDKSNVKFYIDGVLVSTFPQTGQSTTNTNPIRIGANSILNGNWFNGKIDDIRIYNRILSNAEIQRLFNE